MSETSILKTQQKLLSDRIDLCSKQIETLSNLQRIRARSNFIATHSLQLTIYKFTPNDHVELVIDKNKPLYSKKYEEYRKLKKKEEAKQQKEEQKEQKKNKGAFGSNGPISFLLSTKRFTGIVSRGTGVFSLNSK